jgi:serine/threonine-protein kinase
MTDEGKKSSDTAFAETVGSDDHLVPDDGFRAGMRVTERIRLGRLLGRGGMGSVWVARNESLDTEVAVKFIASQLSNKTAKKRFEREARIAASLTSPHSVKVFDHGLMEDGTPFIVMELLRGEALADRLERSARLTLEEVKALVEQVAGVLGEAHDKGIIHRDIKPHNLFLLDAKAHELYVKVLDFGVAKQADDRLAMTAVTQTGALVGTPLYMSPEQLLGTAPASSQSDLWALGIVAYEALVGRVPFTGETVAALGVSVAKGSYALASSARPDLGSEIDDWFEHALRIGPEERFASASEMASAFASAIDRAQQREVLESAETQRPADLVALSAPAGTFDGAASSRGSELAPTAPRRAWWVAAAVLAAAALAVGVRFGVGGDEAESAHGVDTTTSPEASATTEPPTPPATAAAIDTATSALDTSTAVAMPPPPKPAAPIPKAPLAHTPPPAATPKSAPTPNLEPAASAPAPAQSATRPAYCSDPSRAFDVDANGKHHLKPECMK